MKKYLLNNNGSTLILTLALITIFSILYLSLASGGISNFKQINRTEDDIQTTSLAEMGIQHQISHIVTGFNNIVSNPSFLEEITDEFFNKYGYIDPDEADMETVTNNYYEIVINKFANELATLNIGTILLDEKNQYEIVNYTVDKDAEGYILIDFTSKGYNSNVEVVLQTNITIPIKSTVAFEIEYRESDSGGGNGGGSGGDDGSNIPDGNQIEEPKNLTKCSGNFLNGGQCEINGSYVLGNGNNTFKNATIKINGTLNVNGNLNNSTNSTIWINGSFTTGTFNNANGVKLHVTGNANFNSTLNNLENSIFEILNGATFNNIQNAKNTVFYIKGQTNINGHLDLESKSIAYIDGNLTISKNLTVDSSSKLCVNGNLTINGNIKGTNVFAKSSNNRNVNTDDNDFIENCTTGGGEIPGSAKELLPYLVPKDKGEYSWEDLMDYTIDYN